MKKFIQRIMLGKRVEGLKPRDVTIFNVNGNYGNYHIKIGPVNPKTRCRCIEINGKIHHLFVTRKSVEPLPHHEDIEKNMRGTVIMRDINIRLFDDNGHGVSVKIEHPDRDGVHSHKLINLAGDEGERIVHELEATGKLANETYHIVQEDILKSLA